MPETTNQGQDKQLGDVAAFTGSFTQGMKDGQPDYSDPSWKVGGAGLYWQPDDDETPAKLVDKDGAETIIETTIDLGVMGKGNNLSLSVEQGVANYVRELGDDLTNHLPNTKVGVMIHYLSEGIARDFGTTWSSAPASLGGGTGRGGSSKTGRAAGQRVMTKKEKNELLNKLDMSNYEEDIQAGRMTLEEAMAEIQKAYARKKQIEDLGYYLSPNKTEGVLHYNWKNIIDKTYSDVASITGSGLYVYEKLEVLLPNIYENYFANNREHANRRNCQELIKSDLKGCVMEDAGMFRVAKLKPNAKDPKTGGLSNEEINSNDDILKLVGHKPKGQVMGIHLAKSKRMGMMKPRYVVVDEYLNGRQNLYLYHANTTTTLKDGALG